MDMNYLILSFFLGLVGTAYIIYGKKQQNFTSILSGLALCIVPYFITNLIALILGGLVLIALPFILRS